MRRLNTAKCSFCGKHAEVFEQQDARICRVCLGKAMSCAMKSREPETEGDKQEAEAAPP